MNFNITSYDSELHRPQLERWWKAWGFHPLSEDMLPAIGLVALDQEETPVAAGFIYRTDSRWALLEWVVRDPNREDVSEAVDLVIKELIKDAKNLGHDIIYHSTPVKSMASRLIEGHGFQEGDRDVTTFVKVVTN